MLISFYTNLQSTFKHSTMKTYLTFIMSIFVFNFLCAQKPIRSAINLCDEEKTREYVRALGHGLLLHTTCADSTHFFFLIDQKTDTIGKWLNEKYTVRGTKLKITSIGNKFFVVRKSKHSRGRYQYDFKKYSWHYSDIPSSSWSTGNREDP